MPAPRHYGDYASGEYLDYQKKYAATIRESDKVLISLARQEAARAQGRRLSLLDIGCSSGNLLLHLRHHVPELDLSGGDAYPGIIEKCRANPELAGISFEVVDVLKSVPPRSYDIVVVNAVLFLFENREFDRVIANIAAALHDNGTLLAFDLFDPYEQDLTILERSKTHPEGLTLHIRPYTVVRDCLARRGFGEITITPFAIPIDLPAPADLDDISSRTVRTESGERQIFRGALYTPWCHLAARKAR